jgi:hypothetical protein
MNSDFDDNVPEDKGLFTFYREQAEREEEIEREKKFKKQMKRKMIDITLVSYFRPPPPPPRKKPPVKISPEKDNDYRQRWNVAKERLIESVVGMIKQIERRMTLNPTFYPAD